MLPLEDLWVIRAEGAALSASRQLNQAEEPNI